MDTIKAAIAAINETPNGRATAVVLLAIPILHAIHSPDHVFTIVSISLFIICIFRWVYLFEQRTELRDANTRANAAIDTYWCVEIDQMKMATLTDSEYSRIIASIVNNTKHQTFENVSIASYLIGCFLKSGLPFGFVFTYVLLVVITTRAVDDPMVISQLMWASYLFDIVGLLTLARIFSLKTLMHSLYKSTTTAQLVREHCDISTSGTMVLRRIEQPQGASKRVANTITVHIPMMKVA